MSDGSCARFLACCIAGISSFICVGRNSRIAQRRPRFNILLNRLVLVLVWLSDDELDDELKFSEELLLLELASDDVLLREVLRLLAAMMSSRRTSYSEGVT